jgi:predicted PurR-regulated permease PerM
MVTNAVGFVANFSATIAASGLTLINTVAIVLLTPVLAFYLLLDWDKMVRTVDGLLPRAYREEIKGVLAEIDRTMAGWIRGQGSVILVDCIYYGSSLSIVGLNYGLAIGLIAGTLSFVPFLGFVLGFTLSMAVALVQFNSNWLMIAVVFLVFMIGQFLEGNVLYPKLVGSSININPVWLIFALFAFALLFGFVGLLLAVPLTAIAGVLARYAVRKYKASSLYIGPSAPGDSGPDQPPVRPQ